MKINFQKLDRLITNFSGSFTASVLAFIVVIVWILGGFLKYGFGSDYQMPINSFTTIITFLLAFLIQHSQNKDTEAIQIKLDAIIHSIENADNKYIGIEKTNLKEIKKELDF